MGKLLALGPDSSLVEVLRRFTLASADVRAGAGSAWFTTPEQLQAEPHIR